MILLFASIIVAQSVGVNPSPSSPWALNPNGDNKASIQAAIDWCESNPGRETLTIPPGVWNVSSSIELVGNVVYVCEGATIKNIDASFQKSIIVAGASNHPSGGGTRDRADDVEIVGLTVEQNAATSASSHGLFAENCDRWKLTRVKVKNSKHEGIVSGGMSRNWVWDRVEAHDCGAGSQHRTASGAGINCNGHYHTLIDCTTYRSGQGFESAGTGCTWIRCRALEGNPLAGPCIGFNLGNAVFGLYKPRLIDCESSGHPLAISVGNVNGRCGGVVVDGFKATNGTVAFSGGKGANAVLHPDEGPDVSPSTIRDMELAFTVQPQSDAFVYAAYEPIYGRAPLTVEKLKVRYSFPYAWNAPPPMSVAGNVTASVRFIDPEFHGFDAASVRGDFAAFNLGPSLLPTRTNNIRVEGVKAFKADGTERHFRDHREGPQ